MSSSVCTEKKTCFHLVEKVVIIHRGDEYSSWRLC